MPETFPVTAGTTPPFLLSMRLLGVSLAIAVIVYVVTAGHVLFLPLLFVPIGLLTFGGRRRSTRRKGFF